MVLCFGKRKSGSVPIVEAGLDRILTIERNGRLSTFGYLVNLLIAASCMGALAYPLLDAGGILRLNCIFKSLFGMPCPTCGYSTAIGCVLSGDFSRSFLHNPGWIFWVFLLALLVYVGMKSVLTGKQAVIPRGIILPLAILVMLTWVAKFIIGAEYY